jgi:hypothetical protein
VVFLTNFQENVEHLLAQTNKTLEETQEDERENFRRYKLLEANALQQKTKLEFGNYYN